MRILNRYLLRQHATPFVFALTAMTAVMLLNQVAKKFGDLVGKDLPWSVIAEVFVLSIPFLIAMTIPMAVLVSVLYALSRLASDHEITAMRASGLSLGQLMRPLLAGASGVAVVAFLFSDHVLPRTNHRLRGLQQDIGRTKPTFSLKEQVMNEVQRSRFFLRANRIDQSTFALHDVTIYDLTDQDRKRIIYADSGYIKLTADQTDLHLTLFDGSMHEFDRAEPKMFQQMDFRQDAIRVAGVGNELRRSLDNDYRGDREMGVCEMEGHVQNARREERLATRRAATLEQNSLLALVRLPTVDVDTAIPMWKPNIYCRGLKAMENWLSVKELEAQQGRADSVRVRPFGRLNEPARQVLLTGLAPGARLGELRALSDRARTAAIRQATYLVELHKKLAIATACIVFVLVGVPTALRFPKGGVGLVVGVSLSVFGIYYMGLIGGETIANRRIVSPALAMWSTNIVFAAIGLIGLWRTRSAMAVPRGGRGPRAPSAPARSQGA